ncbi:MAG: ribbon-helix-helix protein, CopG family [Salinibacterium sp.]|nr:ribbon-helix-helix protein, CopG family [Salinibacterium sp.]
MAILERRVQVLFDPAQYAALEAEAAAQRQSVASVIREAVDERLRAR